MFAEQHSGRAKKIIQTVSNVNVFLVYSLFGVSAGLIVIISYLYKKIITIIRGTVICGLF